MCSETKPDETKDKTATNNQIVTWHDFVKAEAEACSRKGEVGLVECAIAMSDREQTARIIYLLHAIMEGKEIADALTALAFVLCEMYTEYLGFERPVTEPAS